MRNGNCFLLMLGPRSWHLRERSLHQNMLRAKIRPWSDALCALNQLRYRQT